MAAHSSVARRRLARASVVPKQRSPVQRAVVGRDRDYYSIRIPEYKTVNRRTARLSRVSALSGFFRGQKLAVVRGGHERIGRPVVVALEPLHSIVFRIVGTTRARELENRTCVEHCRSRAAGPCT